MITRTGVILGKVSIKDKKKFTITHLGYGKRVTSISRAKTSGKYTRLPRFAHTVLKSITGLVNNLQEGLDCKFSSTLTLKPDQEIILEYLKQNVYSKENRLRGTASTILQMNPGCGKTYVAMAVIHYIQKKTLIIVPNIYILRQWTDALESIFSSCIGCYYGIKKIDGDIVVAVINSAMSYPDYDNCGLIIYDEVHLYCSSKSANIFTKAQAQCCLGLSATPTGRIDGFDRILQWELGNIIYAQKIPKMSSSNVVYSTKVLRVSYNGADEYTQHLVSSAGVASVPLMLNQIQNDPQRNNLIIQHATRLYNNGKNVFVFSDRRAHLIELGTLLNKSGYGFDAPELDIRRLMGGASDDDIKKATTHGRIILTTYQYTAVGVSITKMNAIILATPRRSNMRQILGRIYRLTSDASIQREIVDIVDNKTCLKNQYYDRKKEYHHLHADIEYVIN